jgi:hypothetical protein
MVNFYKNTLIAQGNGGRNMPMFGLQEHFWVGLNLVYHTQSVARLHYTTYMVYCDICLT